MNPTLTSTQDDVIYPDSDGKRMADNTLQYEWIVTIKGNLDDIFAQNQNVFVAGDNLIYPVRGNNKIRQAPDIYVAFGRPKGHRGSYRVWEEGGIFPQVVFEVLSPGNRAKEMMRKRVFYQSYGVEEYYVIDPDDNIMEGWIRAGSKLREVDEINGFISPRLAIKFDTTGSQLLIYRPGGQRFLSFQEVSDRAALAEQHTKEIQAALERANSAAEQVRLVAQEAHAAVERANSAVEQARVNENAVRQEAERLRNLLQKSGIDPDKPTS
jgi:Uma2 family endonuclease